MFTAQLCSAPKPCQKGKTRQHAVTAASYETAWRTRRRLARSSSNNPTMDPSLLRFAIAVGFFLSCFLVFLCKLFRRCLAISRMASRLGALLIQAAYGNPSTNAALFLLLVSQWPCGELTARSKCQSSRPAWEDHCAMQSPSERPGYSGLQGIDGEDQEDQETDCCHPRAPIERLAICLEQVESTGGRHPRRLDRL